MKHQLLGALLSLSLAGIAVAAPVKPVKTVTPPPAKKPVVAQPAANTAPTLNVTPLDLLKAPGDYLNKRVAFEGTFNNFSTLGLDYKRAFRDSKDYISFLIKRPDVTHHTIPLAELKLIYPRKQSEALMHLETGNQISVRGQVFSTALGEPWIDVQEVKVLAKSPNAKPKADKGDKKE